MAWNDLDNLSAGDVVTETHMDEIRGNIEYLLTPNSDDGVVTGVSDNTTTSTSWVAVDTTNWRKSITTNGGTILIVATFTVNTGVQIYFDFALNGTRIGDATYGQSTYAAHGSSNVSHITVVGITTPTAGTYNIDLYWKMASATTGTIYNNTEAGYMMVMEG